MFVCVSIIVMMNMCFCKNFGSMGDIKRYLKEGKVTDLYQFKHNATMSKHAINITRYLTNIEVMLSHLAQLEQLKMYKHNTGEPSRDWD